MSEKDPVRSALLRYYTDQQVSQSARLIGFTLALFTLFQIVQSSRTDRFSYIFPALINIDVSPCLKFLFFFCLVWVLFIFLIRAIFRFSVFGLASGHAIFVTDSEVQKMRDEQKGKNEPEKDEFHIFHDAVFKRLSEKRVFGFIRVEWFYAVGKEAIGYLISVIFGFVFSVLLLWLLW